VDSTPAARQGIRIHDAPNRWPNRNTRLKNTKKNTKSVTQRPALKSTLSFTPTLTLTPRLGIEPSLFPPLFSLPALLHELALQFVSSVRVFSSCLKTPTLQLTTLLHTPPDKPREHCSWRRPSKPSFPLRRRYPSPASRAKRPMENLLYNGLGGLRRSADEGSLLHDTRPYAAKKREERAFVRARAAAHSAAHSKSASAPATAVHPLADHQVAAATTPSRVHVPFGQTEGEPLEVCESLSPSKAHAPGNAVPVHELHTRMPDAACGEEEPESCGLPARRTWDEGGATTGAVAPRGTPKGPCTPPQPKEAQHGTCFIRSNTADGMPGLEPVEDMPAHPSLGSSWQAMQKRKEEDLRVCVDEDSDALACGGGDDKENMHTNGSWFCNVRTPSTVIVSPIESDPDKMPLAAPHAEPANNKRRRDFQTDPLGHAACGGSSSTPRSAQDNLVTHDGMYDIMCLNSH
jgi:hypothetical protein